MIRVTDARPVETGKATYFEYSGLHNDTKPTDRVATGSLFTEVDTGDVYAYDEAGQAWGKLYTIGGGGGGGATNLVTGTFMFSDTGAHDVDIPYTGDGYILTLHVIVEGGVYDGDFKNLVQQYACQSMVIDKRSHSRTPTYNANASNDLAAFMHYYKSSASSATPIDSLCGNAAYSYNDTNATGNPGSQNSDPFVKIRSKNKLSVYTASSDVYCFANGISYRYFAYYTA